jgi:hypothetical protein
MNYPKQNHPANAPRFVGSGRGLLFEPTRTNHVTNPRFEGATPGILGSGGVSPTNMALANLAGITLTVLGTGREAGMDYFDFRMNGTATSSVEPFVFTSPSVASSTGQVWTASVGVRLLAGSTANISTRLSVYEFGATSGNSITTFIANSGIQRVSHVRTFVNAGNTTGNMRFHFILSGAVDITFRLYWPQFEVGEYATTPILPPVGSPAASVRGGETYSSPLSALGIADNGACTVLLRGSLGHMLSAGSQNVLQIDDGSSSNRWLIRQDGGSSGLNFYRSGSGASATGSTIQAGQSYTLGVSIGGLGRAIACVNGVTPAAIVGGPTSGLTTLRLGANAGTTERLFGAIERLEVLPYGVSDADLVTLVNSL